MRWPEEEAMQERLDSLSLAMSLAMPDNLVAFNFQVRRNAEVELSVQLAVQCVASCSVVLFLATLLVCA